jgi:hypothetical protein
METILLNKMKPQDWLRLSRGGKQRNKKLLEQLAEWDKNLQPAEQLGPALALSPDDLTFLNDLALRLDGWHRFVFSELPKPWNHEHLAALGLIRLACPSKKISLTDAGRFLLTLTRI